MKNQFGGSQECHGPQMMYKDILFKSIAREAIYKDTMTGIVDKNWNLSLQLCNVPKDVLQFSSDNITDIIALVGPIYVNLFVSSDAVDTDFTANVVDVFPDGLYLYIIHIYYILICLFLCYIKDVVC